jgi:hypothetical protein
MSFWIVEKRDTRMVFRVWKAGQVGIIPIKNSGGVGEFNRTIFVTTEGQ